MGRSPTYIVVLAPLALLGACLEMAPRSSVPFQAAADRQARYAVEIALAVKENRRADTSEAAANGRMVSPQLPEIWGPPTAAARPGRVALELDLARLEPGVASFPTESGCALPPGQPSPDPVLSGCRQGWRGSAFVLPPPGDASIAPAAAAAYR